MSSAGMGNTTSGERVESEEAMGPPSGIIQREAGYRLGLRGDNAACSAHSCAHVREVARTRVEN